MVTSFVSKVELLLPNLSQLPEVPKSFNRWDYALATFRDLLHGGTTTRYSEEHGVVSDPAPRGSVIPGKVIFSEKSDQPNSQHSFSAITVLKDDQGVAQLYYVETKRIAIQDFGVMVGEYSRVIEPLELKHFSKFKAHINTQILKDMIEGSLKA